MTILKIIWHLVEKIKEKQNDSQTKNNFFKCHKRFLLPTIPDQNSYHVFLCAPCSGPSSNSCNENVSPTILFYLDKFKSGCSLGSGCSSRGPFK